MGARMRMKEREKRRREERSDCADEFWGPAYSTGCLLRWYDVTPTLKLLATTDE